MDIPEPLRGLWRDFPGIRFGWAVPGELYIYSGDMDSRKRKDLTHRVLAMGYRKVHYRRLRGM